MWLLRRRNTKTIISFAVCFGCCASVFCQQNLDAVIKRFDDYSALNPTEKVYLHSSGSSFLPGETIYFKSYLVDGMYHRTDSVSNVVYVDLLDEDDLLKGQVAMYSKNGMADGRLQLPIDLPAGKYFLRAYTNYMKNAGTRFFFVQEISIGEKPNSATIAKEKNRRKDPGTGYALDIRTEGDRVLVGARNGSDKNAPSFSRIFAHARGSFVYASQAVIDGDWHWDTVKRELLPSGIIHFSLLDSIGESRAEKLFIISIQDTLKVSASITAGSVETVVDIVALDNINQPVIADFSASINRGVLNSRTDIDDYLLLNSDIALPGTGGFKLRNTQEANHDLESLKWERFIWPNVLSGRAEEPLLFYPENGISVTGSVLDEHKKPARDIEVTLLFGNGTFAETRSNNEGVFYFGGLHYYDTTQLVLQAKDRNRKQGNYTIKLNKYNPMPVFRYDSTGNPQTFGTKAQRVNGQVAPEMSGTLEEVVVKSRIKKDNNYRIYDKADASVIDMKDLRSFAFRNIYDVIAGRIAGVQVSGNLISIRGAGGQPLFLLDGAPVDKSIIDLYPVAQIGSIEILKGPETAIFGARGANGVVAIYSLIAEIRTNTTSNNILEIKYPGLQRPQMFVYPESNNPNTTWYWAPHIKTNISGQARIVFKTPPKPGIYYVEIQGISPNGLPGKVRAAFEVR